MVEIGGACFWKCPLTSVTIPEGVTTIGKNAFAFCSKLTSVTLSSTLKTLGAGSLQETKITSIELPEGLETIGDECFLNTPITAIKLPASLTTLGGRVFTGTEIASYEVANGSETFSSDNGVLYTASKNMVLAFPPKSTLTEYTLPSETVGIDAGAFEGAPIQKITLGNKFVAINEYAFCKSKLSEINMPESLVFIGEQAFAGTNLTKVVLPSGLPLIQQAVFAECASLSSVTIPAAVTLIDNRAFYKCTALATINCLGSVPPEIEYYDYAIQSPFHEVPATAVVNVPSNKLDVYKASSWKGEFTASQFVGSLPGIATPATITPANDAEVSSFDGVVFTFDGGKPAIVKSNPAVKVIAGRLVAGTPIGDAVSVDDWMLVADGTTGVRLFPADYDSYLAPFNMELGKDYYVTIPAGVMKDADGNLNEQLTLHYKGAWVKPVLVPTTITPESGTAQTQLSTFEFTFSESATLYSSKYSSIKIIKGSLVDGVPSGTEIPVEQWWAVSGKTSGTSLGLFIGDEYDGYTMPITLEDGSDYFVIFPEGLFRASSQYSKANEEIILKYSKTAGVELVKGDAVNLTKEIYTTDGRKVAEMEPGHIYIVRQGNQVSKVLAK